MGSGFCIKPFWRVGEEEAKRYEDYRLDCIAMLKAIIGQMGRHIDRLDDTERGLIDAAVNAEWEAHGIRGSIDGVISSLKDTGHVQGEALAIAIGSEERRVGKECVIP